MWLYRHWYSVKTQHIMQHVANAHIQLTESTTLSSEGQIGDLVNNAKTPSYRNKTTFFVFQQRIKLWRTLHYPKEHYVVRNLKIKITLNRQEIVQHQTQQPGEWLHPVTQELSEPEPPVSCSALTERPVKPTHSSSRVAQKGLFCSKQQEKADLGR